MCVNHVIIVFFKIKIDLRSKIVCIAGGKRPEPDNLYPVYGVPFVQFSRRVCRYDLNVVPCLGQPLANLFDMRFYSSNIREIAGANLGYFQN